VLISPRRCDPDPHRAWLAVSPGVIGPAVSGTDCLGSPTGTPADRRPPTSRLFEAGLGPLVRIVAMRCSVLSTGQHLGATAVSMVTSSRYPALSTASRQYTQRPLMRVVRRPVMHCS
jgi:hypothetical protein